VSSLGIVGEGLVSHGVEMAWVTRGSRSTGLAGHLLSAGSVDVGNTGAKFSLGILLV
jgi:2-succinyl-5-enolpyruvyl-6-hydroxy-3-cyclohexene-1-carboxylate synthase